jgi:ribosomal protein S18 acetylase RimI-like enzyme
MSITVRKATLHDGKILAELGAKTFYDTFRAYNTEEDMQTYIRKSYGVDLVDKNLANNTIQYFIAYDEQTPVGYTKLIKYVSNEKLIGTKNIELEKIYVLKEYLDKKVGKELMVSAIQYAREEAFDILFLGVWQDNERAIHFYKNFGFETFTTRVFQLGNQLCDDYLMKLEL